MSGATIEEVRIVLRIIEFIDWKRVDAVGGRFLKYWIIGTLKLLVYLLQG